MKIEFPDRHAINPESGGINTNVSRHPKRP
ncbi:MAG: hypothetical protein QG567_1882 [Campylobacterota bacterium]|nr:hypothetical protein [Campylobacterota bacterium]